MEKRRISLNVPIKLGVDGDWLVSEAKKLTSESFQCLLERSVPLSLEVKVVMILPAGGEGKKSSQKINCEGIVQSVDCIQDEKMELKYQVEVFFKGLTSSEKKLISLFSKKS
jgi:hypothetical protein